MAGFDHAFLAGVFNQRLVFCTASTLSPFLIVNGCVINHNSSNLLLVRRKAGNTSPTRKTKDSFR